jgi:hypothetical protein
MNRPDPDLSTGFEAAETNVVALIHLKNGLKVHLNLLIQYAGDKEEVSLTFFGQKDDSVNSMGQCNMMFNHISRS